MPAQDPFPLPFTPGERIVAGGGGFIGGQLLTGPRRRGYTKPRSGVNFKWQGNFGAPEGVNGRNSDNAKIKERPGREPSTTPRDGMDKTYRWTLDEIQKTAA